MGKAATIAARRREVDAWPASRPAFAAAAPAPGLVASQDLDVFRRRLAGRRLRRIAAALPAGIRRRGLRKRPRLRSRASRAVPPRRTDFPEKRRRGGFPRCRPVAPDEGTAAMTDPANPPSPRVRAAGPCAGKSEIRDGAIASPGPAGRRVRLRIQSDGARAETPRGRRQLPPPWPCPARGPRSAGGRQCR